MANSKLEMKDDVDCRLIPAYQSQNERNTPSDESLFGKLMKSLIQQAKAQMQILISSCSFSTDSYSKYCCHT